MVSKERLQTKGGSTTAQSIYVTVLLRGGGASGKEYIASTGAGRQRVGIAENGTAKVATTVVYFSFLFFHPLSLIDISATRAGSHGHAKQPRQTALRVLAHA